MAFQRAGTFMDRHSEPVVAYLSAIDWLEEARLIGTAVLIAAGGFSIMWLLSEYISRKYWNEVRAVEQYISSKVDAVMPKFQIPTNTLGRQSPPGCRGVYTPHYNPYKSIRRMRIRDKYIAIWGWPSRGGVIVLNHADSIDFEFLGLDHINPPKNRLPSQADEDKFCKQLLLLGAKWWDSEQRYNFLAELSEMDDWMIKAIDDKEEPCPTMGEKRWVSVGWSSTGGLWVAEFDTDLYSVEENTNQVPEDTARLTLARTMNERCQILRDHFEAKFYERVEDYEGYAFINAWGTKVTGEVGPLMVWGHGAFEAVSPGIGPKTQFSMP